MKTDLSHSAVVDDLKERLERHEDAARMYCGITNDLNNLLAAIKGHAQLAKQDPDGPEMGEFVDITLTSIAKAQNIIQLGLSRIAAVDEYETIAPVELVDPPEVASTASATRILVVDDEESMRHVLKRILEKNGYEVTTVSTGTEAIEISQDHCFDIAFVDLRLGDTNGVDVFREIRARSPATHVIFVSGDPSLDQVRDAKGSDKMAAFVKKPFDVTQINELVSYILTMRAALAL